jgi:hypothetical protein
MEASQIYDVDDAREIQFSQTAGQISAPRFTQPVRDFNCEFELGRSYFDARYEPVNDSTASFFCFYGNRQNFHRS